MLESVLLLAFLVGTLSALSLPLGTLTTLFWTPSDRSMAWLMAFGAGALLAALTIDLVATAVERGDFNVLALGCVVGSLTYLALNQLVNNKGGFLRKTSTTVYHLKRDQQRQFGRMSSSFQRLPFFKDLPEYEAQLLAGIIERRHYPANATLYRRGDPSNAMYLIEEGEVQLLDPQQDMQPFISLGKLAAFGRMAFITGATYQTVPVTRRPTAVWAIDRDDFSRMLGRVRGQSNNSGLVALLGTCRSHHFVKGFRNECPE